MTTSLRNLCVWVVAAACWLATTAHAQRPSPSAQTSEDVVRALVGDGVPLPVPFPRELAPPALRADTGSTPQMWFAGWAKANAPICPTHPLADTSSWVQATNRGSSLPFRLPPTYVQDLVFGNLRIGAQWLGLGGTLTLDHYPLNIDVPASFGVGHMFACRFRGSAFTFIIDAHAVATGYALSATPVGATGAEAFRLSGSAPSAEQLDVVWTVLASIASAPYGTVVEDRTAASPPAVMPVLPPGPSAEQIVRAMVGGGLIVPSPFPLQLGANPQRIDSIRAQNTQPSVWVGRNAPECPEPRLADTTHWMPPGRAQGRNVLGAVIDAPSVASYPIRLPPGYTQDTTFQSFHGGARWIGPDGEVSLQNGWWGVSGSAGRALACRFVVASGTYLVQIGATPAGYSFFAYLANAVGGSSLGIAGLARTPEQLAVLWTVTSMLPR